MENLTKIMDGMVTTAITWIQTYYLNFILAIVIFVVGRWLTKFVTLGTRKIMERAKLEAILIDFLAGILNAALLIVVVVAALNQLGVETTSIVAILGAASLAVGLALKDSLQNFAAGVMLILFKPFKTGDYVEMAGTAGFVEKIHIFSTLMRTPDNKEITVPNGSIYGSNIVNYSARPTRRVDMTFGISYDDDIAKAKQIIRDVLAADERILDDPKPIVAVSAHADSSINFIVRPWVKASDYWGVFWATHENLKIAFDENDITIPYPQMDVHMDKV